MTLTLDHATITDAQHLHAAEERLRPYFPNVPHHQGGLGNAIARTFFDEHTEHGVLQADAPCPTKPMPLWLGNLTVTLLDAAGVFPTAGIPSYYARTMQDWPRLDADAWRRVEIDSHVRAIEYAIVAPPRVITQHPAWAQTQAACLRCIEAVAEDDAAGIATSRADASASAQFAKSTGGAGCTIVAAVARSAAAASVWSATHHAINARALSVAPADFATVRNGAAKDLLLALLADIEGEAA